MTMGTRIIADLYRDSVSLMKISSTVSALPGVVQASCIMATPANLDLLREAGLLDVEIAAGPNEVLVAIEAEDAAALAAALDGAEAELHKEPESLARAREAAIEPPRSQEMALDTLVGANLALIATPGPFAAAEASKALRLGLNAMVFSDNVAIEDEIALKRFAERAGLMVLGPDCGTAVIDGVPLGFANVVRRGNIGVVAASGTGLQQVICLVDSAGGGISQAIGTGGRDLDVRVGGVTMMRGIRALADDPDTAVIVLISKPPAPDVAAAVMDLANASGKPVVACLLGAGPDQFAAANIHPVVTLEDAAAAALALARGEPVSEGADASALESLIAQAPKAINGRRYLRGLYSGGTFCYEALSLLGGRLETMRSNTSFPATSLINDPWHSEGHTVLDLGDDVFTRGRPHPMIDHRLRNERLVQEAADPETAVVLIDVVLGCGAHDDPAAAMAPALAEAQQQNGGSAPALVGFVCGTDGDPQGLARQKSALREAGVLLANSNAEAVRLAAAIVEAAT
ncbi:MAG: acyl-CoA synthetase FdrA [Alphaproteobacteria bacterium]|nr:acyl-CoA synthetase FdrA [Alphaproteobacteria bacterium]